MTTDTIPTTETVAQPAVQTAAGTEVTPAPEVETDEWDKERAKATILKLREIEKQAKQERKELETLKAEKKAKEDAELSEIDRLKKQADEAKAQNAKLQAEILRRDVIAKTGLPAVFADRLKGETEEDLTKDAEELLKLLPQATTKPNPKLSPSNPSGGQGVETDAAKRERLFGHQGSPLDLERIKAQGGGVIWNK